MALRSFATISHVALGLAAFSLFACSSEDAATPPLTEAGKDPEVFDDGGADADETGGPEDIVFVETSDPKDFASCSEPAPAEPTSGRDFCPGAECGLCDRSHREAPILFARASDFGEGTRFLAMRDDLVLAEDADGTPRLLGLAYREGDVDLFEIPLQPPPPADMRGRAIAGSPSPGLGHALLCNEESCTLYDFHAEDDEIIAKPAATPLPMSAKETTGIFRRFGAKGSPVCLFGDGIHCRNADGSFAALATGERGKLLAVDEPGAWLVGEKGRIVHLDGDHVTEPYRGIDARLHTVAARYDDTSAWAAGEGGLVLALGEAGPRACKTGHEIMASTVDWHGLMAWIDDAGTWIQRHRGGFCFWDSPMEGVFAVRSFPCGIAENRWMLSAEEFRGEMRCIYD